jgi:hypothetical protein
MAAKCDVLSKYFGGAGHGTWDLAIVGIIVKAALGFKLLALP